MSTITIRGLTPEVVSKLKKEASRMGLSMNRFIVKKLEEEVHDSPYKPKVYHDLDHLFGSLSEEEFQDLNAVLEEQRQIDEQDWQ